jgi:hypothetical protein
MQVTSPLLVAALLAPSPRDIDPRAAEAPVVPDDASRPVSADAVGPRPARDAGVTRPVVTPTATAPAPARPASSTETDRPSGTCFQERASCYRLTAGGIGLLVGGAGVLATGIAFRVTPDYPDPDEAIYDRSLHPPGVVMIAAGATLVATSIAMLVAGRIVHRRARRSAARTSR